MVTSRPDWSIMLSKLMAALAAAWAAVAVDLIAESSLADGAQIKVFGRAVAEPAPDIATLALVLAGVSIGVIVTAGIMAILQNRKAKALGKEIQRRSEERSLADAGLVAKNDLLSWRIDELQQQVDQLILKRDKMLDELSQIAAKTQQLRREARLSKETLAQLTEQPVVMPELRSTPDDPAADR
jgi:hypothetical protein